MPPPTLNELIAEGGRVEQHRPWPRIIVGEETWRFIGGQLAQGAWTLLGLWGDSGWVHVALLEEGAGTIAVASLECPERRFPSLGRLHLPAARLERAVRDVWGLEPAGAADLRPWLDHHRWDVGEPLGSPDKAVLASPPPYSFLPTEGESLHRIP